MQRNLFRADLERKKTRKDENAEIIQYLKRYPLSENVHSHVPILDKYLPTRKVEIKRARFKFKNNEKKAAKGGKLEREVEL